MTARRTTTIDLASIRRKLARDEGRDYWRCLEELADAEGFRDMLHREFPRLASVWTEGVSRRKFLALMGASLALAGLSGCGIRPPAETIVPYVRAPEEIVPGKPLFYATSLARAGVGTGVLVECHEGRPTKVEGNPGHPASLGATDVFAQAAVLAMYDPDRSRTVTHHGKIGTWPDLCRALRSATDAMRKSGDAAGLRLLTGAVTSPTLARQIQSLLEQLPGARWHQYEPAGRDTAREGARLALGEDRDTHYDFERADVVLSLGADFLVSEPGSLRYAHQFMDRRRVALDGQADAGRTMNRLYQVEPCPSSTGVKADHRWRVQAGQVEAFARGVAGRIDERFASATSSGTLPVPSAWVEALVEDLKSHRGKSVVIAGGHQRPAVHALAHAMNDSLGNVGQTVFHTRPIEARPINHVASLSDLIADMEQGRVDVLVILGGNPAYDAPADLHFAAHLGATDEHGRPKVPLRVRLGLYEDETSELCDWHVPEAHQFEAWSDVRAFDGTASIVQPLIEPLYGGKSYHELVAALSEAGERSGYDVVRETWHRYWEERGDPADFETFWQTALHDGTIAGTAFEPEPSPIRLDWLNELSPPANQSGAPANPSGKPALEIVFRPDPCLFDGRFANNGWLQELPKPLTKITWDNAALISPATAEKLGLSYEVAGHGGEHGAMRTDVIELDYGGRKVEAPVWILPGHADDSVTLHLGYGRTRAGRVGTGVGTNAYRLRTSRDPWSGTGLTIRKTGRRHVLACTQQHHLMEGRRLVRSASFDEYCDDPHSVAGPKEDTAALPSLYSQEEYPYQGYKWGMTIDLTACVGCNACIVACQSENNIPVVGKDQVTRGREMHWIRLDRYYQGDLDAPATDFQPVPCMHCENAPCELVCPVGATVHSDEGLNDMIYNRCVGTRYCSNNCPYKVRRFNFLEYAHADWHTPVTELFRNPDVTVRSRGVMEKCTYCVQRINHARIEAEKEDRSIRDGEVVTACQAACPARAIRFGDLNDPESGVVRQKKSPRNYGILTELNTRPRTTYLGVVRNPNPEIQDG